MTQGNYSRHDLGNKPLIVVIGLIASLIGIFAFLTGKHSIPEILGTTTEVTNTPPRSSEGASTVPAIEFTPSSTTDIPSRHTTPSEISTPFLEGKPSTWLPDPRSIPDNLSLESSGSSSNESVAQNYSDPARHLSTLEALGRISGYYHFYFHDDGCDVQTGLRSANLGTTVCETPEGAQGLLDWHADGHGDIAELYKQNSQASSYRVDSLSGVGDDAYQIWFDGSYHCQGDTTRYLTIVFRRHNALGMVRLGGVKGTVNDQDLLSQGLTLARSIDRKFVDGITH